MSFNNPDEGRREKIESPVQRFFGWNHKHGTLHEKFAPAQGETQGSYQTVKLPFKFILLNGEYQKIIGKKEGGCYSGLYRYRSETISLRRSGGELIVTGQPHKEKDPDFFGRMAAFNARPYKLLFGITGKGDIIQVMLHGNAFGAWIEALKTIDNPYVDGVCVTIAGTAKKETSQGNESLVPTFKFAHRDTLEGKPILDKAGQADDLVTAYLDALLGKTGQGEATVSPTGPSTDVNNVEAFKKNAEIFKTADELMEGWPIAVQQMNREGFTVSGMEAVQQCWQDRLVSLLPEDQKEKFTLEMDGIVDEMPF